MIGFGRTLRNLGSRASAPAMAKANATAIGTNTPRRMTRHTGRGSSAGLNAEKTARLEMNGTGYANIDFDGAKAMKRPYPKQGKLNKDIRPAYTRNNPNVTFDHRKTKMLPDK